MARLLPSNTRLREFRYIDEPLINSLAEQLDVQFGEEKSITLDLSLTGVLPTIKYSRLSAKRVLALSEKVDRVAHVLHGRGLIGFHRPNVRPINGHRFPYYFYMERCKATKVILPCHEELRRLGVKEFSVWISDPNPADLDGPDWIFRGSFLYLTELRFDDGQTDTVFSGCSALRFIANAASNAPFMDNDGPESLGRASAEHPVDKLRHLGAAVGDSREIETMYRVRYMTDEQCFTYHGRAHRVHDILAYPVFIAIPIESPALVTRSALFPFDLSPVTDFSGAPG